MPTRRGTAHGVKDSREGMLSVTTKKAYQLLHDVLESALSRDFWYMIWGGEERIRDPKSVFYAFKDITEEDFVSILTVAGILKEKKGKFVFCQEGFHEFASWYRTSSLEMDKHRKMNQRQAYYIRRRRTTDKAPKALSNTVLHSQTEVKFKPQTLNEDDLLRVVRSTSLPSRRLDEKNPIRTL